MPGKAWPGTSGLSLHTQYMAVHLHVSRSADDVRNSPSMFFVVCPVAAMIVVPLSMYSPYTFSMAGGGSHCIGLGEHQSLAPSVTIM